jgi:hypothetical protein
MTPAEMSVPFKSLATEICCGALAGAHPKVAAVYIDGLFVEEPDHAAVHERLAVCQDLVLQLTAYCCRKLKTKPNMDINLFVANIHQGLGSKNWGLSDDELDWAIERLSVQMGWLGCDRADDNTDHLPARFKPRSGATVFQLTEAEVARLISNEQLPMERVKTVVDAARAKIATKGSALPIQRVDTT